MKRTITYLFIIAAFITSCRKTTKSKVVNEWKVTSYVENYSNTNEYDEQTTGIVSIDESNFSHVEDASQGTDHTVTGKIAYHNYTIKKDGTWSWESDVTTDATQTTVSRHIVKKESGTWSFVGKTRGDEFKKNERLLFNTLYKSETVTDEDEPNDPTSLVETYLVGEKQSVYTVIESKSKKLKLEKQESNTWQVGQNLNSGTRLIAITLEEK